MHCTALACIILLVTANIACAQCLLEPVEGECTGRDLGQTYRVVNKSPDHIFKCTVAIKKNGAILETRVEFVAPGQRKLLGCTQGGINRSEYFSFELTGSDER